MLPVLVMNHPNIEVCLGELSSEQVPSFRVKITRYALLKRLQRQSHILVELQVEEAEVEIRLDVCWVNRQRLHVQPFQLIKQIVGKVDCARGCDKLHAIGDRVQSVDVLWLQFKHFPIESLGLFEIPVFE